MNNYFESALKNYIKSLPNEKEAYYLDTNTINFKTLINFLFTDMVLCNNITKDYDFFTIELGEDYDEEGNERVEVFQYFIVDYDSWRLAQYEDWLAKNAKESDFILYYDNRLELYILGITHFGTSWDCVPTPIKIERDSEENE